MDREALLIAEYAEAGHSCRAQESYVRATLSMYLVLSASGRGSPGVREPVQCHTSVLLFGRGGSGPLHVSTALTPSKPLRSVRRARTRN